MIISDMSNYHVRSRWSSKISSSLMVTIGRQSASSTLKKSRLKLKDVLPHSKLNGNSVPLKTIVSPISILVNVLLPAIMFHSLIERWPL